MTATLRQLRAQPSRNVNVYYVRFTSKRNHWPIPLCIDACTVLDPDNCILLAKALRHVQICSPRSFNHRRLYDVSFRAAAQSF